MKSIIEWFENIDIVKLIIAVAIIIFIIYNIVDYTCGWSETSVKVRDKTWARQYRTSTDSNGNTETTTTIHYYLMCDIGKMEVNKRTYEQSLSGHEYLVLAKDIRIRKIIREINMRGER